jgi:hypothetical protein
LAVEAELNDRVAALYGLTAEERRLLERGKLELVGQQVGEEGD